MKMSEKMKSMTPEERAAWKKKMADAKAAKAAARAQEGAPVVIGKAPKKSSKPVEKAKPRMPSDGDMENSGSGGDDDGWLL